MTSEKDLFTQFYERGFKAGQASQSKGETKTFYVCGTTWAHEIGETEVMFYKTPEEAICGDECTVMEVKMSADIIMRAVAPI